MDLLANRKRIVQIVFSTIAVIFILRLLYIQVINKNYRQLANNNVLRKVTLYPARGLVYDRNGKLILYNQAEYDLLMIPGQVKAFDTAHLCQILSISDSVLKKDMKDATTYSRYKPSVIEIGRAHV